MDKTFKMKFDEFIWLNTFDFAVIQSQNGKTVYCLDRTQLGKNAWNK